VRPVGQTAGDIVVSQHVTERTGLADRTAAVHEHTVKKDHVAAPDAHDFFRQIVAAKKLVDRLVIVPIKKLTALSKVVFF
jgi:hypothetical protein